MLPAPRLHGHPSSSSGLDENRRSRQERRRDPELRDPVLWACHCPGV